MKMSNYFLGDAYAYGRKLGDDRCDEFMLAEFEDSIECEAAAHAIRNHDALVEVLELMLDAHGEGNCRYVRGCCQEHFDLTGDGSCYIGKAKQMLKNAKGES